jgi:hypothetical protein
MATYRRTLGEYRGIAGRERTFRNEIIETESITEEYVAELRRQADKAAPSAAPKARLIKRADIRRHDK